MTIEVPVWIQGVGIFVGVVIATVIARLGLNNGRAQASEKVEVAGAIVNSKSIELLAGSIEGQTLAITEHKAIAKEQKTVAEAQMRATEKSTEEIKDLTVAVRDLATQIARRR